MARRGGKEDDLVAFGDGFGVFWLHLCDTRTRRPSRQDGRGFLAGPPSGPCSAFQGGYMARVSASAAFGQSEVLFRNLASEAMNPNIGLVGFAPFGLAEWASNAPPETEDPDEDDEDEDEEEGDEDV